MIFHESLKEKDSVIIFFTGWGCDENCTSHLSSDKYDIITVYDYTDLSNVSILLSKISNYTNKYLIAWSFGVKIAQSILSKELFIKKIAVNGTIDLIDKNFGIPPEIFARTQKNISEENLISFYKNMTLDHFSFFGSNKPLRSFSSIKNELSLLDKSPEKCDYGFYDEAFVSSRDLIIPSANQSSFWHTKCRIKPMLLDAPHYPFYLWNKWESILND